jgi:hypothetical protein
VGDVDVMEVCGEADAGGLVASMITLVTHTLALCTAAELGCRVRSGGCDSGSGLFGGRSVLPKPLFFSRNPYREVFLLL